MEEKGVGGTGGGVGGDSRYGHCDWLINSNPTMKPFFKRENILTFLSSLILSYELICVKRQMLLHYHLVAGKYVNAVVFVLVVNVAL